MAKVNLKTLSDRDHPFHMVPEIYVRISDFLNNLIPH